MDLENYLPIFLEESEENLQIISDNLLKLENDKNDKQAVNEIFRAAHTLKGMAATMGFQSIADLTHGIENLLDEIRNGSRELTDKITDVLFLAFDNLQEGLEKLSNGEEPELDSSILDKIDEKDSQSIADATLNKQSTGVNEYQQTVLNNAQKDGFNTYKLEIILDDSCLLKSARAFMIYKDLDNFGEIIKSQPSIEDLEEENFENNFTFWFVTKAEKNKILELEKTPEIQSILITDLNDDKVDSPSIEPSSEKKSEQKGQQKKQATDTSNQQVKAVSTIRVDTTRLDSLMNLVSELVINKTSLNESTENENKQLINEGLEGLHRVTTELQNVVMSLRMVPVERVFNRFPRMVRDTAKELNKKVSLTITGKETELDRTIIDEIGDPLVHLIRNAIDHGLESTEGRQAANKTLEGNILLKAYQSGNEVFIEVSDDGKGIDVDKIRATAIKKGVIDEVAAEQLDEHQILQLIFEPGFSTSEAVTDLSGRGVGLDVVKTSIESLGGGIEIHTQKGQGSTFTIHLPLTLAIIQGLLIKLANESYAIPLSSVVETASIERSEIQKVGHQEVYMFRGNVLPIVNLSSVLGTSSNQNLEQVSLVIVKKGDKQIGLLVDDLIGQQEIVIKSLGQLLNDLTGFSGATISGDGKVMLILDTNTLFN
ncbi:chemotaxis protein CheA [Proteinivorax hydrogeniformans]|uniref:Chemotaxis protein CheA n=1 Tax=Proteinivorax hydrogeniformans TaxID=1826727 RepID=A0AAU8HPA6_9FIRM